MDREERLRRGTKTVQCLIPPSFVHMIMICRFQSRLTTDDEMPMFPYITAYYSLSTVLLSTLLKLKVKHTLLYYDACVM